MLAYLLCLSLRFSRGAGFPSTSTENQSLQCTNSVRISFAKSGFWPKAALRHGYPPTNVAAWRGDTNAPLRVVRKLFPASAGACFSAPVACGARSGATSPASHRKSDALTTPSACQPPGATDPPLRSVENVLGQPALVFWWARASDCVEHFF